MIINSTTLAIGYLALGEIFQNMLQFVLGYILKEFLTKNGQFNNDVIAAQC